MGHPAAGRHVERAVDGNANLIVAGDRVLLRRKAYEDLPIVTVASFRKIPALHELIHREFTHILVTLNRHSRRIGKGRRPSEGLASLAAGGAIGR
jgi:hypothetical protein